MSGTGCACCSKSGSARAVLVVLGLAAAAVAVYVTAVVLAGVFSWHGLAFSFGLTGPGPLRFALAVRCTTFALLIELGAVVSLVLDYLDGRRAMRFGWAWAIAHVTLVRRIAAATGWLFVSMWTLAGDVADHPLTWRIGQTIGTLAFGLGHHLARQLAALGTACTALASLATRGRRTPDSVVAVVTRERSEAIPADVVGDRIDDAA
jgi:hypothetical protein